MPEAATDLIDALVLEVGPAAAFPGRPALLGQPVGSNPFLEVSKSRVAVRLGDGPTEEMANLARAISRRSSRGTRKTLRRFARDLAANRAQEREAVRLAFALCARASLQAASKVENDPERVAARVAAEELVVAAVALTPAPPGVDRARR